MTYRKFPKYSDTQKICCNHSKIWTMWLCHRVMSPNDADWMANSVDPDQTAPLGAVWSWSALFAPVYLSENLGSLRYYQHPLWFWKSVIHSDPEYYVSIPCLKTILQWNMIIKKVWMAMVNVLKICTVKFQFWKEKYEKFCLLPFASLVRREYKFRLFFHFWCSKF